MNPSPSPWTFHQPPADSEGFAQEGASITASDGTVVADVCAGIGYAEQFANGNLLKEAPALLQALQSALYTIRALDENYDERDSYIAGTAAIAKATGEQ